MPGLIMITSYPKRSGAICFNTSPRPVAKHGLLIIKNGQSLPNCKAYRINDSFDICKLNFLFSNCKVKAPSAEPPPNPAPSGIDLCKCIVTEGKSGKSF